MQSRRDSRTQLHQARSRRGSAGRENLREGQGKEIVGPDFVDMEEDEDEEEGEEVDENEMKKVVMGRVGGWVDWAVGWMDFRVDGEEDGDGGEDGDEQSDVQAKNKGQLDPVELQKRLRKKKRRDDELETGPDDKSVVVSPPEQAGIWNDAKWLLTVATNAAL